MYENIKNKKWKIKGEIEEQWTTLTHEEFAEIEKNQEKLASLLQEYGVSKNENEHYSRRIFDKYKD